MRSFIKLDTRTGKLTTFQGDFPELEQELVVKKIKRVSRIVPKPLLLRALFYILRAIPGDPLADWCRRWRCVWVLRFKGIKAYSCNRGELIKLERALYYE